MITSTTTDDTGLDDSAGASAGTTFEGSTTGPARDDSATDTTGVDPGVACPQIYAPVCGKDGETYDNACVAGAAGVEIRREGPCVGDCEGSCVIGPQGPGVVGLVLLVLALVRPRQ